jgi:hypothetical protein
MNVHRIDLRPDMRPGGRQWGKTPMLYRGEVIGSSHDPEYAAARWLLDDGMAAPEDRLETYRGETLCMRGIVGKLAKWTVVENKDGDPTFTLSHWKPFPGSSVGSPAPETASEIPISAPEDAETAE